MPWPAEKLEVLDREIAALVTQYGTCSAAAVARGVPVATLQSRWTAARARGWAINDQRLGLPPPLPPPLPEPEPPAIDMPPAPDPEPEPLGNFEDAWRTFRHHIDMAQDRYTGPALPKRQTGRTKTLVISDLHAPFHDAALLADVFTRHGDADRLVIAGDLGDGFGLSKFIKYKTVPYEEEIAAITLILQQASERFPEVVIIDGNHDHPRLEKALCDRLAPEMVAAIRFMTGGTLSPIHVLCKRFDNVRIAGHQIPDGRRLGWCCLIGDALIAHAEKFSAVAGNTLRGLEVILDKHRVQFDLPRWRLLVQAHTHTLSGIPGCGDRWLSECACLCTLMDYQLTARVSQATQLNGYLTFEQSVDGKTDLNSVRTHWYDVDATVKRSA